MLIQGVHHISLRAHGPECFQKALAFYRDFIGLPLIRAWGAGRGVMLDAGGCILEILSTGPETDQDGHWGHIAFRVEQVDAAVERLRAAGYPITKEPKDLVLGEDYPIRVAFCRGPLDEEIELFQER